MDASALQNLTPEQKQAVMAQAQQQANQQIMSSMIESMTLSCFDKCAGTSGDRLDSKEQSWYVYIILSKPSLGFLCGLYFVSSNYVIDSLFWYYMMH